jgi:hypothetical protein
LDFTSNEITANEIIGAYKKKLNRDFHNHHTMQDLSHYEAACIIGAVLGTKKNLSLAQFANNNEEIHRNQKHFKTSYL